MGPVVSLSVGSAEGLCEELIYSHVGAVVSSYLEGGAAKAREAPRDTTSKAIDRTVIDFFIFHSSNFYLAELQLIVLS